MEHRVNRWDARGTGAGNVPHRSVLVGEIRDMSPVCRYCRSGHLLEWNAVLTGAVTEAEHRNAWAKLFLCAGALSCKASHKTEHCGQRQVPRAHEEWSAMLTTTKFATLDQCSATDRTRVVRQGIRVKANKGCEGVQDVDEKACM